MHYIVIAGFAIHLVATLCLLMSEGKEPSCRGSVGHNRLASLQYMAAYYPGHVGRLVVVYTGPGLHG